MVKTTVRVQEGTRITEALKANLNKIIQQDIEIESYSEAPDLQGSYIRRVESLEEAFLFIMKAIPPQSNAGEIFSYMQWCRTQAVMPKDATVDQYQEILANYTALLSNALIDYWFPVTLEEKRAGELTNKATHAIELLNKAEQYVIMKKGRNDLATLSTLGALGEAKLVLQWEKQLPPCSDETLRELDIIKNSDVQITPKWFQELKPYQQVYFHASQSHIKDTDSLKIDINQLQAQWIQLKAFVTLANLQKHAEEGTDFPVGWGLSSAQQSVIKAIVSCKKFKASSNDEVERALQELSDLLPTINPDALEELSELRQLPYWFLPLSEHEQRLLKTCLTEQADVKGAVSFLPSRLRTLPAVANFAEHHLLILSAEGESVKDFPTRLRLSNPASRDVKGQPIQIEFMHTRRNVERLRKFAGDRPLFIQTLISPISVPGLKDMLPDHALDRQRRNVVTLLENKGCSLHSTNHPLNVGNKIYPTQSYDLECNAFYQFIKDNLLPAAVESQMATRVRRDKVQLSTMASECITFTTVNSRLNAFTALNQLIKKAPASFKGCSLSECKEGVTAAFEEAGFIERSEQILNDGKERTDHEKLVDFFVEHYPELSQWEGWQSVFANHCYVANNHPDKAGWLALTEHLCDIAQLNSDYSSLLNSGFGTATIWDYNGRELWLSSLENVQVILTGGMGGGACVSGKDRKALELIHTDSILLYREIYGKWPTINDTSVARENFVNIVSDLYVTRHAHQHAGQNAPGADGIKHPGSYWPKDIARAIRQKTNSQSLKIDDTLATNNEVARIGKPVILERIKNHFASSVIAAKRLCAKGQEELLTQLKCVVEEKSHWTTQRWAPLKLIWDSLSSPSPPEGIGKIRAVLKPVSIDAPVADMVTLANVYYELNQREEDSSLRLPPTQALYSCLREIYQHENPDSIYEAVVEQLGEMKKGVYSTNTGCAM
jgi:hypothetical protein